MIRLLLLALPLLLAGCLAGAQPTQSDPTCSWTSAVPAHPDAICRTVFHTIAAMLRAEVRGNRTAIRDLSLPRAAPIFLQNAYHFHAIRARGLHVVPSITLETDGRRIGARYNVLGTAPKMHINEEFTIQMQIIGRHAIIAEAKPPLDSDSEIE